MNILGADIGALFDCVGQIFGHRNKIQEAAERMEKVIEAANWVGPDRDYFVDHWTTQYRPMLYSVLQGLTEDSNRLRQHAERQAETSGG